MRKFLAFLLILILLAGGGYGFFWYTKSNELKSMVEADLAQLNTGAAGALGMTDRKLISYSGVSVSGFPTGITVKLENPVISIPVHSILGLAKTMETPPVPPGEGEAEAAPAQADPLAALASTPWIEEHSIAGNIGIGVDLFTTRIEVSSEGTRTGKSIIGGEEKFSFSSTGPASSCTLKLDKPSMMGMGVPWNFTAIREKLSNEMDKLFEGFSCEVGTLQMADAKSNEALVTLGGFAMDFNLDRSDPAHLKVNGLLKLTDSKSTPAMDKVIETYLSLLNTNNALGMSNSLLLPIAASELGTQNANIEFALTMPKDESAADPKTLVFDMDVKSFSITNDIMKMSSPMHFATAPQGERRTITAKIGSVSSFTEKYDAYKRKEFDALADYLYESENNPAGANPWTSSMSKEQLRAILQAFLPELSPLGEIKLSLDVTGDIKNDPINYTESAKIDIAAADFITALYAVKTKGKLEFPGPGGMPIPQGSITMDCQSCESIINRAYAYAKGLEEAIAAADPNYGPHFVTEEKSAAILAFLKSVAQPKGGEAPSGKDWAYALAATPEGMMSINGHGPDDLMLLYNQHLASIMTPATDQPAEFQPEGSAPAAGTDGQLPPDELKNQE